jgi:hypothetical protein
MDVYLLTKVVDVFDTCRFSCATASAEQMITVTDKDPTIEGAKLPAGKYSFFCDSK